MKKVVFLIMPVLVGVYLIYEGVRLFTFSGRGEAIYRMGMLISANDKSLYTHGAIAIAVGLLLFIGSLNVMQRGWKKGRGSVKPHMKYH